MIAKCIIKNKTEIKQSKTNTIQKLILCVARYICLWWAFS